MVRSLTLCMLLLLGGCSYKYSKSIPHGESYAFYGQSFPQHINCDYGIAHPYYILFSDSTITLGTPDASEEFLIDLYGESHTGKIWRAKNDDGEVVGQIQCHTDKPTGVLKCQSVLEYTNTKGQRDIVSLICGYRK